MEDRLALCEELVGGAARAGEVCVACFNVDISFCLTQTTNTNNDDNNNTILYMI